jgi:Na+/H+-translocating membrane pyrophosphatase
MKNWIRILFVVVLLMNFISANDTESLNVCGGDQESIIQCVGDNELSYIANLKGIESGTQQIIGFGLGVEKYAGNYKNLLIGSITLILLLSMFIIFIVIDKRRKNQKPKNPKNDRFKY